MLFPFHDRLELPRLATTTEQALWMVVAAAEQLAAEQPDRTERARYAEAVCRMMHAVRLWWSDDDALNAASPTFTDTDGRSHTLVEVASRFHGDSAIGVRAAVMCFLAFKWRLAA